jgi:hypothetical protein
MRRADPSRNRIARLLSDLKLHRPLRLLLHDNRARGDMTARTTSWTRSPTRSHPRDLRSMAVEQCKFSGSMIQLQPNPDGPDPFWFQWGLLAEQLALVPPSNTPIGIRRRIHESLLC